MSHPGAWRPGDLMYCSNVHPAESAGAVEAAVGRHVAGVRKARGLETMAAGLWLSRSAAAELKAPPRLAAFAKCLQAHGIELATLNGFPYGGFHETRVKERVYQPDWADPARLDYTLDLAEILAACLPAGCAEGTISSLPLGARAGWTADKQRAAALNLAELARDLDGIRRRTGRPVRLCLEMEPDCALETSAEAVAFFQNDLARAAEELGVPPELPARHLGVCFDICHQAVMFEDIAESLVGFHRAGVAVGKIQVSSALEIQQPGEEDALRALRRFDEPRYLHQVRTLAGGVLQGAPDLPPALDGGALAKAAPWRVHFHVPIQAAGLSHPALGTTRPAILQALDFLKANPACRPHLEVETYTWQVLPEALRPQDEEALTLGITEELNWLEAQLNQRGLLENRAP